MPVFYPGQVDYIPKLNELASIVDIGGIAANVATATANVAITAANVTLTAADVVTAHAGVVAANANVNSINTSNTAVQSSASLASTAATAATAAKDLAVTAWAASTAPSEALGAFSGSLHVGAVVKAIVYDTAKDSDGGAWRKRCEGKSWYTESLGGSRWIGQQATIAAAWTAAGSAVGAVFQASATAGPITIGRYYSANSSTTVTEVFRGITREFPAVAGIVAESGRVVIYDLTNNGAMWMVFTAAVNNVLNLSITSLAFTNGVLLIGGTVSGMATASFLLDSIWGMRGDTHRYRFGKLSGRNTEPANELNYFSTTRLVNSTVNDIAITALDNAPIDPATGLPVPTIAVATAGGVSVIKDNGTVANMPYGAAVNRVTLNKHQNRLLARLGTSVSYGPIPATSVADLISNWRTGFYNSASVPAITVTSLSAQVDGAVGDATALTLVKENPTTPTKGMVSYITNQFNTGWQVGDSRLATLADTTAETITESGELVTNGTFDVDTAGWVAGNSVISVDANRIKIDASAGYGHAYQDVSVVAGKPYVMQATASVGSKSGRIYLGIVANAGQYRNEVVSAGTHSFTITPTEGVLRVRLAVDDATSGHCFFDNISVKLAQPDRSVKNNGLIIKGTLTKSAVATGTALVGYSGFSAANYLEQPYTNQLDFGTGDFCVMGWVRPSSFSTLQVLLSRTVSASVNEFVVYLDTNGKVVTRLMDTASNNISTLAVVLNSWSLISVVRVNSIVYVYINEGLSNSYANTSNLTRTAPLTIGAWYNGSYPSAPISLLRISATAPSADQIAHIYRTELPLFQPNAQCCIAGTSTAVTALAYDDVTDLLHVGTSWGRSGFKDLLRVDSEATTTGSLTSLSAQGGTVLTGGTSARMYLPSLRLRDELKRKDEATKLLGKVPVFFDYDAVTSQTAFLVPKGYTTKAVYSAEVLKREGSGKTYTRSFDGFQETINFAVAPGNTVWVRIMAVKTN